MGLKFLTVAALVAATTCAAQTHTAARRHTSPSTAASRPAQAPSCHDTHPFDPAQMDLPKGYCGVDVEALYKQLEQLPQLAHRTEFETTAAYNARRATVATAAIAPGIQAGDLLGFVFNQGDVTAPLTVTYDADRAVFTLEIRMKPTTFYTKEGHPNLIATEMIQKRVHEGSYVGTNAMGVKVEVSEYSYDDYGVALVGQARTLEKVLLNVPPEQAPSVKPLLAIAFTGTLQAPWTVFDTDAHEATISDPINITWDKSYVVVKPIEAIVFRKDTGEVLRRINLR